MSNFVFSDKEKPKVAFCPNDQYVKKEPGQQVTWPEPQFTDNVGIKSVDVQPYKPGTDLDENDYRIVYTASDSSGNFATCEFNVYVTGKYALWNYIFHFYL